MSFASPANLSRGRHMNGKTSLAAILSLACSCALAGNGSIAFSGHIFQPTVNLAATGLDAGRDIAPLVASVRMESLATHRPGMLLLDYFVGYLHSHPAVLANASLVDITYQ
jgi:hypothetical protein